MAHKKTVSVGRVLEASSSTVPMPNQTLVMPPQGLPGAQLNRGLAKLPTEILRIITSFLTIPTLLTLRSTCKPLRDIVDTTIRFRPIIDIRMPQTQFGDSVSYDGIKMFLRRYATIKQIKWIFSDEIEMSLFRDKSFLDEFLVLCPSLCALSFHICSNSSVVAYAKHGLLKKVRDDYLGGTYAEQRIALPKIIASSPKLAALTIWTKYESFDWLVQIYRDHPNQLQCLKIKSISFTEECLASLMNLVNISLHLVDFIIKIDLIYYDHNAAKWTLLKHYISMMRIKPKLIVEETGFNFDEQFLELGQFVQDLTITATESANISLLTCFSNLKTLGLERVTSDVLFALSDHLPKSVSSLRIKACADDLFPLEEFIVKKGHQLETLILETEWRHIHGTLLEKNDSGDISLIDAVASHCKALKHFVCEFSFSLHSATPFCRLLQMRGQSLHTVRVPSVMLPMEMLPEINTLIPNVKVVQLLFEDEQSIFPPLRLETESVCKITMRKLMYLERARFYLMTPINSYTFGSCNYSEVEFQNSLFVSRQFNKIAYDPYWYD